MLDWWGGHENLEKILKLESSAGEQILNTAHVCMGPPRRMRREGFPVRQAIGWLYTWSSFSSQRYQLSVRRSTLISSVLWSSLEHLLRGLEQELQESSKYKYNTSHLTITSWQNPSSVFKARESFNLKIKHLLIKSFAPVKLPAITLKNHDKSD